MIRYISQYNLWFEITTFQFIMNVIIEQQIWYLVTTLLTYHHTTILLKILKLVLLRQTKLYIS